MSIHITNASSLLLQSIERFMQWLLVSRLGLLANSLVMFTCWKFSYHGKSLLESLYFTVDFITKSAGNTF